MEQKNQTKETKKDADSETLLDQYGVFFWVLFFIISFSLSALGAILIGYGINSCIKNFRAVYSYALILAGVLLLTASAFYVKLFPAWSETLRKIRMLDARIEGAMSVASIAAYEKREVERKNDMEDAVTTSITSLGKTLQNDINSTNNRVLTLNTNVLTKLEALEMKIQKRETSFKEVDSNAIRDSIIGGLEQTVLIAMENFMSKYLSGQNISPIATKLNNNISDSPAINNEPKQIQAIPNKEQEDSKPIGSEKEINIPEGIEKGYNSPTENTVSIQETKQGKTLEGKNDWPLKKELKPNEDKPYYVTEDPMEEEYPLEDEQ